MTHTRDIDKGFKRFKREMQKAKNAYVDVGIVEGGIAEYAAYNEYGTKHIPSRPFMRIAFDENKAKLNEIINMQYGEVTKGKSVYNALSYVGMYHKNNIQMKIESNIPPKNADSTIARKRSSRTLIDTGTMKNSVTYLVGMV